MSQEASTPPTGGARQARIDEAIASWLTPSTPPSVNEKEKQPKDKDYKDNKEKDKNKEKSKDEEGKQPVAKDKRIMAAVSEWSGSAVAVKDVKKQDKKEKKEAKRREKEEKRREKEEKQKKEASAATPKQKKPFFRSSTAGRHESSSSIPTSSSNPQISALAAPEEPIDDTTPVPLRLDTVQYLLQSLRRLNGEETEGIFRIPGNTNVVKRIWRTFLQESRVDLEEYSNSAHDFAGALKLYLREAPESAIPSAYTPRFLDALRAPDPVLKVFGIAEAIHDLPFENKHMIREICTFLKDVQDNFAKTKMDLKNIAIAFGPSFFPGAKGAIFDFKTIGLFCEVVTILVTNLEDIFADMELEMETKPNGKDVDSSRSTNSGKSTPPFSYPTTPPDDDGQTRGSASSSPSVTSTRRPSHGHITVGSRIQRQSSSTTHDDYESELEAPAVEAN